MLLVGPVSCQQATCTCTDRATVPASCVCGNMQHFSCSKLDAASRCNCCGVQVAQPAKDQRTALTPSQQNCQKSWVGSCGRAHPPFLHRSSLGWGSVHRHDSLRSRNSGGTCCNGRAVLNSTRTGSPGSLSHSTYLARWATVIAVSSVPPLNPATC